MNAERTEASKHTLSEAGVAVEGDAPDFRTELSDLLNRHNKDNIINTPDYILRDYLCDCLTAFDRATQRRDVHTGRTA